MPPKETQLTKRPPPTDQQLMPPPPKKRIKRPSTVLDEDLYTSALSEIIARDFYPGLLENQESGPSGFGTGHGTRTTATGVKNAQRTASETPTGWGGETPMSVTSTGTAETNTTTEKSIPDISNMNLLTFQATYTSEDNESFNTLLDRQNAKRRDKYTWLWSGNKIPSARQIAHQEREKRLLTERGDAVGHADGGEAEERKALVKTDLDKRPAKPETWDAKAENSLMFMPDSIEDSHETIAQRAEMDSRMGPKRVVYRNTRLPAPAPVASDPAASQAPSPSLSAIQDAIAGRPRLSASEAGSAVYTAGGETPRVNGYAFVDDDEPQPQLQPSYNSLDKANPFTIPQNRKREDLHHRMVDRMSRVKRAERANVEIKTPVTFTPRFGASPVFSSANGSGSAGAGKALTPAAQKLLRRVGSTPRSGNGSASRDEDESRGNMWTPTPKRR